MKKTANILFVGFVLLLFLGAYNVVRGVLDIPTVQKTFPDNKCVKVLTPEGEKTCDWLAENKITKYNVEYVFK